MLNSARLDARTAQTYRTTLAFGSKERTQHTTQQPHQHDICFQAADQTTPTYRTTHPPTDQAIHPPNSPPTMLQQYSSKRMRYFVLELRQSRPVMQRREQNTAVVPKTITAPPSTGRKAPTLARNDRHPPTHITNQPPAIRPTHPTTKHSNQYVLQQYHHGDWSVLDFLSRKHNQSWVRCTSSGV